MGQRHQIYVQYRPEPACPGGEEVEKKLFGFHHQWLWGYTACRQLSNLLSFYENAKKKGNSGVIGSTFSDRPDAIEVIQAIYSVDISSGYYHRLHRLDGCEKPEEGDNNNGITVIDFTGERPRYGFVSLFGLECLDTSKEKAYKNWVPMGAEEYLSLHYPNFRLPGGDPEEKEWNERCRGVADRLGGFEVLKTSDLKEIFPKSSFPPKRQPLGANK